MALTRGSLIEHLCLPCVHRYTHKESGGWDNETLSTQYTFDVAEKCTVQATKAEDLEMIEGGLKNTQYFTLFCGSQLYEAVDGTDLLSSAVYLPDAFFIRNGIAPPVSMGGWFTVVKNCFWGNGLHPHGEFIIAKDTTPKETEYPLYAALEVNPLITSREDLKETSSWKQTWLDFNED